MSLDLLMHLQREHAFDPTPVRHDLGVYHVPFAELVGDAHPEHTLSDACLRPERVALTGEGGAGKSSLAASVLGPLVAGVAPVVVPVAREAFDVAREPRAMFAHLVSVIGAYAHEASLLDDRGRDEALGRVTAQRPVGRAPGRSGRLTLGWMGAQLGAELARQATPSGSLDRSATETLETVHQMVETIRAEAVMPVLVFDDTDRWVSGSAYADPAALDSGFFGRVLPDLTELRCGLVVAVHRRYLQDDATRTAIQRTHTGDDGASIGDVVTDTAVRRLFDHYRQGLRGELRGVVGAVHIALAEACDDRVAVIGPELIEDALTVWDPA